ncbi:hypothetical protein RN001_015743 [Aquatica leii]|uniref:Solute carrier family 25 member 46 n=1 Tax=Aquatica leii TaxID=1421715 RepID=A0AAN7SB17_9COLE|nr:hypothetical protein RN001_015743 [Aquatica leii]
MAGLDKYSLDGYPTETGYWDINETELCDIDEGYNYEDIPAEYVPQAKPALCITSGQSDDDATLKKFITTGVSIVSLIAENLLSHPFVVLRRQCQVHHFSKRYHIFPTTLVPVIYHLHSHQGLTTLWKGLGSTLILRGMTLGVEDLLSKVTPWPKEISRSSSVKSFFQHIFLKSVSLIVIMPYYTASLVETVQSDIASEKPGMLDVFKEGTLRLLSFSGNSKGRMLPIWVLTLPTITLGIARYLFSLIVKSGTFRLMQIQQKENSSSMGTLPKNLSNIGILQDVELNASLIAVIASDIVFYPFETILHRLYLQGTRTIIDNLETGRSVLAILTNYRGPVDCYESCLRTEGVFGLYKGFGALILQYIAHIFVVRVTKFILTEISAMYRGRKTSPNKSPKMLAQNQLSTESYLIP